jgi:hypothetical protein
VSSPKLLVLSIDFGTSNSAATLIDADENTVEQVLRYIRKIKEGTAKDKDGKTINVGAIPFYAHILCSLMPRIKAIADNHDFVKTPDNEGYFRYHQSAGC